MIPQIFARAVEKDFWALGICADYLEDNGLDGSILRIIVDNPFLIDDSGWTDNDMPLDDRRIIIEIESGIAGYGQTGQFGDGWVHDYGDTCGDGGYDMHGPSANGLYYGDGYGNGLGSGDGIGYHSHRWYELSRV